MVQFPNEEPRLAFNDSIVIFGGRSNAPASLLGTHLLEYSESLVYELDCGREHEVKKLSTSYHVIGASSLCTEHMQGPTVRLGV